MDTHTQDNIQYISIRTPDNINSRYLFHMLLQYSVGTITITNFKMLMHNIQFLFNFNVLLLVIPFIKQQYI